MMYIIHWACLLKLSGMQDILLNIIFGMQIEVNMYNQAVVMVLFLLVQYMKTMKRSCM